MLAVPQHGLVLYLQRQSGAKCNGSQQWSSLQGRVHAHDSINHALLARHACTEVLLLHTPSDSHQHARMLHAAYNWRTFKLLLKLAAQPHSYIGPCKRNTTLV